MQEIVQKSLKTTQAQYLCHNEDNPLYPAAQMTPLTGAILNTFTPCRFA